MSDSIEFTSVPSAVGDLSIINTQEVVITKPLDILDLLAEAPSTTVVLYAQNFAPDFFDLSTRKLGDLLQKCVNYRTRLAVIGAFDHLPSKALHAFIFETNQQGDYPFTATLAEALAIWAR